LLKISEKNYREENNTSSPKYYLSNSKQKQRQPSMTHGVATKLYLI